MGLMRRLKQTLGNAPPGSGRAMATQTPPTRPIAQRTQYTSKPVNISSSFLKSTPETAITFKHISFADSELPEYDGCFAVLIDNVLSPWECAMLLSLAEESVPDVPAGQSPWRPALVNMGGGFEAPVTDYRNSDRIIWDSQEVVDRLWQRCLQARGDGESIEMLLSKTPGEKRSWGGDWKFERLNERMRFLKYTDGQFFKPHCDGAYRFAADGNDFKTHYTLHLYLNDSAMTSADGTGCAGGATSFLSDDLKRRLDVDPKAGSVLIFQHRGLLHQGAEVHSGTKYTMRTDILYRWVKE